MEGCPPQENQVLVQLPLKIEVESQCLKDQQKAEEIGAADVFIPDCEPSGLYKEVQCYNYPASGRTNCWCVNQNTGKEIPGTRVNGMTPNCRGICKSHLFWVCILNKR